MTPRISELADSCGRCQRLFSDVVRQPDTTFLHTPLGSVGSMIQGLGCSFTRMTFRLGRGYAPIIFQNEFVASRDALFWSIPDSGAHGSPPRLGRRAFDLTLPTGAPE